MTVPEMVSKGMALNTAGFWVTKLREDIPRPTAP